MCGRFIVSYTYEQLLEFLYGNYQIEELDLEYNPRYNVAPGQPLLSIIKSGDLYKVGYIDWGLIPPFSKDDTTKYKMFNARSETVDSKVSFKDSFKGRRCIILANGYYEWSNKVPYVFEKYNRSMFGFAGLWSVNKIIADTPIFSSTIITKEADQLMGEIHDRMPVIFDVEQSLKWLDETTTLEELHEMIQKSDHHGFTRYEVSTYVNNVRHEGIECVKRVETLDFE